jgi:hypothetical protein
VTISEVRSVFSNETEVSAGSVRKNISRNDEFFREIRESKHSGFGQ